MNSRVEKDGENFFTRFTLWNLLSKDYPRQSNRKLDGNEKFGFIYLSYKTDTFGHQLVTWNGVTLVVSRHHIVIKSFGLLRLYFKSIEIPLSDLSYFDNYAVKHSLYSDSVIFRAKKSPDVFIYIPEKYTEVITTILREID